MSWETTGVAVAAPVLGFAAAYLGYRRSRSVDRVTEQSGLTTESRAGTAQIIEGLNQFVDQLQEGHQSFREDIRYLTARLDACGAEREELRRELARLRRKYGDNGTTPPGGTPATS